MYNQEKKTFREDLKDMWRESPVMFTLLVSSLGASLSKVLYAIFIHKR